MSWEALRLTSRSPGEVYRVLGPHGVDELIRRAMSDCWREYPEETRTLAALKQKVRKPNCPIAASTKKHRRALRRAGVL